jgi:hypothetical protein
LRSAEVEAGTSFLGLNVLIGDDEVEALLLVVIDEPDIDLDGLKAGVISSAGSIAAFFIIPISRLQKQVAKLLKSASSQKTQADQHQTHLKSSFSLRKFFNSFLIASINLSRSLI